MSSATSYGRCARTTSVTAYPIVWVGAERDPVPREGAAAWQIASGGQRDTWHVAVSARRGARGTQVELSATVPTERADEADERLHSIAATLRRCACVL